MQNSLARKSAALLALFLPIGSQLTRAEGPLKIPMSADRWTTTAGTVNFVEYMGKPSIELKAGNYKEHIQSGAATLKDLTFRDGTIEYDVAATSDMGAGFIFRSADKDNFEMFYLRPQAQMRGRLRTACNTLRRPMGFYCGTCSRSTRAQLPCARATGTM